MESKIKSENNVIRIIKGSVFSIIITLALLLLYAILLANTQIPENTMQVVITAILGISILIGSSISSFKIQKKGIANGALVGVIYILFIYVISSFVLMDFSINLNSVIMILIALITGMIGGIIGVNI